MTKVFTTPRFRTAFDRPTPPLEVPAELTSGTAPELTVIDRMVRGEAIIGRFAASPALLGVKVRPTGRPVRVTAHFSVDSMSPDWWEERTSVDGGLPGGGSPRLFLVRSQGRTRGAVLLIRQAADSSVPTPGVACFDLQPDELSADGLFVLEVASIDARRPTWAPAAPLGTVGVRLDLVEFSEAAGPPPTGAVSTGTLPDDDDGKLPLRGGYFVANPGTGDGPVHWIARASLVEPLLPDPRGRGGSRAEPVERRPTGGRGLKRKVRRAARWVVPVAAVPVVTKAGQRAAAFERRLRRATKRRLAATPASPAAVRRTQGRTAGAQHNALAEVMFDLVDRKLVKVELVGTEPGPAPTVEVRARAGTEIEIVTDGPLRSPALVRLSVDPSVLREVPGANGKAVHWDIVRTEA